jgi:hypothetical protein
LGFALYLPLKIGYIIDTRTVTGFGFLVKKAEMGKTNEPLAEFQL